MSKARASRTRGERMLTAAEFHQLGTVPAEIEWFANIDNPRTRRAAARGTKRTQSARSANSSRCELAGLDRQIHPKSWRKFLPLCQKLRVYEDWAIFAAARFPKLAIARKVFLDNDLQ